MKLIVNADDLGYDVDRDRLAFALMESGKVTSSTLMSVAPDFENAALKARSLHDISFGVHLTLTEFRLLSGNPLFRNIGVTDKDNYVISDIRKMRASPFFALQEAIFGEWKLQIEKVMDSGIRVSHLDSHHHIHNTLWILPVIRKLLKHFNIRRCRSVTRYYLFKEETKRVHWRSNFRHLLLRRYCPTRTPDYFAGFEEGFSYLKRHPQFDVNGVVELMCHPGHPAYASETLLLMTDWVDDFRKRWELANYYEL
jgi:chitin disaccharide deacetylase